MNPKWFATAVSFRNTGSIALLYWLSWRAEVPTIPRCIPVYWVTRNNESEHTDAAKTAVPTRIPAVSQHRRAARRARQTSPRRAADTATRANDNYVKAPGARPT